MNGLIIIKEERCSWLRTLIATTHPVMMPLCNKPLLEYLVEFLILCGAERIRCILETPDKSIENYFATGSRWGVEISYGSAREQDQLKDVLNKNSSFVRETAAVIINGFFFVRFDKEQNYAGICEASAVAQEKRALQCSSGELCLLPENGDREDPMLLRIAESWDLQLLPLQKIGDLFQLSMDILARDASRYVLPGYNNEEGIHIGRNVVIPKSVTISKPVLLGNNVQLGKASEIGPGAVIGNNVIIDSGTQIVNSLVLDNTYIGAELTISGKIVATNVAISAENGQAVHFVDQHLLSGMSRAEKRAPVRRCMHWCLSLLFYSLGVVPALLLRRLLKNGRGWEHEQVVVLLPDGSPLSLQQTRMATASPLSRIAHGLALEKVFLLPNVLRGQLDLVGNKPFPATCEGKKLLADFPNYLPGIFYFSEAENIPEGDIQEEITERFFSANRSLLGDIKVICKTFINRW